jgi:hypothetical protein
MTKKSDAKDWTCPDRRDPLASAASAAKAPSNPFPLPASLAPHLAQLLDHWNRLKRGNAEMPFADDVALGKIARSGELAFLLDVFANPLRFRFGEIGAKAKAGYAVDLGDRFADEIAGDPPLDYFLSQATATVEGREPTCYMGFSADGRSFTRLLLPLWGDGRISALLGAIVTG